MIIRILLLLLALCALNLSAAIYKCEINGVLTFSDQPCGNEAEEVDIKVATASNTLSNHSKPYNTDLSSTDNYINSKKIKAKILKSEAQIAKYRKQMSTEMSVLKNMTVKTANNLYGATRSEAIASEMEAITERYRSLISGEQTALDNHRANLNAINSSKSVNTGNSKYEDDFKRIDNYIELKKVNSDLAKHEGKIQRYRRLMNSEIRELKKQSSYANDNLAGATWQNSLASEMSAVTSKYNILIDIEQKHINRLNERKRNLNK